MIANLSTIDLWRVWRLLKIDMWRCCSFFPLKNYCSSSNQCRVSLEAERRQCYADQTCESYSLMDLIYIFCDNFFLIKPYFINVTLGKFVTLHVQYFITAQFPIHVTATYYKIVPCLVSCLIMLDQWDTDNYKL